jgi:hypothetical protein
LNFDSVAQVGLFGYLASGAEVSEVGVENANLTATNNYVIGGLVGNSFGTVSSSYSTGSITEANRGGGLMGWNDGTVSNSYSTSDVIAYDYGGGLLGGNNGDVSNSYCTGAVTCGHAARGLVGGHGGTVTGSFWNVQTSGQATSPGGIGKTTAEMKSITTFSSAGWNIIAVANPDSRNDSYVWNIVDGQTYPFLSWQSVS